MPSPTSSPGDPPREQWGSQLGFLIAAIGSAIGLGNIWRFPGVAYTNGGGAFIVPYVMALLMVGIPVLFLDYSLGHRYRGSAPAVFRRLSRRFEWLGWWQVLVCAVVPALLCFMFVQTAWSYGRDGYGYSPSFEAVFGWGLLFAGAVATVVLTVIPWRTPVDRFTPLDLDAREGVK